MNCCDRLLVVFVVFAFFQYQARWSRDESIVSRPWILVTRSGHPARVHVLPHNCILANFTTVSSSGTVPFRNSGSSLTTSDNVDAYIHVYFNISGPPSSNHRVLLLLNKRRVSDRTVQCSLLGQASGNVLVPYARTRDIAVEYCYDNILDVHGIGSLTTKATIMSVLQTSVYK